MPIPRKGVKIELEKVTPTALTAETLKKELNDVGLACSDTSLPRLERFISEVNGQVRYGTTQTYGILKPAESKDTRLAGFYGDWDKAADGNWTVKNFGYDTKLEYIQYPAHFDWLSNNRPSFTGRRETDSYNKRYETVEAIKLFFVDIMTTASAIVVKGIDKESLNATMTNVIEPLNNTSAKDYDKKGSRVLFLVENYDAEKQEADGIGVLAMDWHLTIKDYKEKKVEPKHDTTLEVNVRSVLYDSLDALEADFNAAKQHFGTLDFIYGGIPPVDHTVKIYDREPPAAAETFQHSLPIKQVSDYLDVLVLFAPDLQLVGSVDNTNSSVTTTYSKTLTTGFTFSSTQSIGFEAGFDAGIVFAKASFKVTFSISFTEQYSKESSETMSFSVPDGAKAFLYQGTLMTRKLRYDPAKDRYFYLNESASFLTEIFNTFNDPLPSVKPVILYQLSEMENPPEENPTNGSGGSHESANGDKQEPVVITDGTVGVI